MGVGGQRGNGACGRSRGTGAAAKARGRAACGAMRAIGRHKRARSRDAQPSDRHGHASGGARSYTDDRSRSATRECTGGVCSKVPINVGPLPGRACPLLQMTGSGKAPSCPSLPFAANGRFLQEIVLLRLAACSNVPISARRHNAQTCPLQQTTDFCKAPQRQNMSLAANGWFWQGVPLPSQRGSMPNVANRGSCRPVLHKGAVLAASRPLFGPFRGKNRNDVHFCAARTAGLIQTAGRAARGKSEGGTLRALRSVGRPHPVSAREEL